MKVYNFEVEKDHSYFVLGIGVLVHNADGDDYGRGHKWITKLRDSRTINFSQDTIGSIFSDGEDINDLIYHLKADSSYAEKIEPIRIIKFKDLPKDVQKKLISQKVSEYTVFTLDNRRLYAAKMAKVKVNSRWATSEEIKQFATLDRFSTKNGGRSVDVRR